MLSNKIIEIKNKKFSFWTNNLNQKDAIVLLPSGISSGALFKNIDGSKIFNKTIIAPDYPARGKSDPLDKFHSIEAIAEWLNTLLNELKIRSLTIVGVSFGTLVADSFLEQNKGNIEKVILISPGDYFSSIQRKIATFIFKPANRILVLRVLLWFLAFIGYGIFVKSKFPGRNLKPMNEQWLSVHKYKISPDPRINAPALLINCKKDKLIQKSSLKKLFDKYLNKDIIQIDSKHIISKNSLYELILKNV